MSNNRVIDIKVRNLSRLLENIRNEEYTPLRWCDEDRPWYPNEREEIIDDLEKTIKHLEASRDVAEN